LKRLLLLGGAGIFSAATLSFCRRRPPGIGGLQLSMTDAPFDTWRALQHYVRQSPDHFAARAEALVAAGDAREILAFIGKDLAVIPGGESRWFDPVNTTRWGKAAVLRSGVGTARELADLAVWLLGRVGVNARVRAVGAQQIPAEHRDAIFAPRADVSFAPPWTEEQRRKLRRQLVGPRPITTLLPSARLQDDARKLARGVLTQFGPDVAKAARVFSPDLSALPVVELDLPEGRFMALPCAPGAPLFPAERFSTTDAGQPSEPWQVQIRLLAATTRAPGKLEELVAKTWSASELIGRHVALRCVPNLTWDEAAVVSFAGVRTFTPMLTVHGRDLSKEQALALAHAGDPITLGGDRITVDGQGRVVIDEVPLTSAAPERESRVKEVISLALEIDARAFPELILQATPRDRDGNVVGGLQPENFTVSEHGRTVPLLMASNQQAPRIALLVDQSRSMPPEYHDQGATRLLENLSALVRKQFPSARLQLLRTDSDLWKWLAIAQTERPDLTIYVTDGDQDGSVSAETLTRLKQSGPTLFIDAVGNEPGRFRPFLDITKGELARVSSAAEALSVMGNRLQDFKVAPYRLSLAASSAAPEIRTVALALLSQQQPTGVRAEATYTAPVAENRIQPPGLCTLAVEIQLTRRHESTQTVRRVLAGRMPEEERAPSAEDLRSVRDALFGYHLLHIEGGGTTEAIRLDDLLESQLSTEGLIKAARRGEQLRPHLEREDVVIPPELLALTGKLTDPDAAGLIYEDGMRMVLFGLVPQLGTQFVRRRVDVLPTSVFRSVLQDPEAAFASTARATAQLAILESHLFPQSTVVALRDRTLVTDPHSPAALGLPYGDAWYRLRAMLRTSGLLHAPLRFLVPHGGGAAAWMLNQRSGELIGILNGAGGAEIMEDIKRQTQEFEYVITVYSMVFSKMASLAGVPAAGTFALSVVAEYGKTLVKLYAAVSYVLINMRAEDLDETVRQILAEFAENVVKEIFPGVFQDEKIAEDVTAVIAVCYMTAGKKPPEFNR